MFVVSWKNLLLGRSDECDAALEAKLKATRAYATVEHDVCEEVTFGGGGFILPLGVVEGVTNFVLVILLGSDGVSRFGLSLITRIEIIEVKNKSHLERKMSDASFLLKEKGSLANSRHLSPLIEANFS